MYPAHSAVPRRRHRQRLTFQSKEFLLHPSLSFSEATQSNDIKPHTFESSVYQHNAHSLKALLRHEPASQTFDSFQGLSLGLNPAELTPRGATVCLARLVAAPCIMYASLWIICSKNAPCLSLLLETLSR